MWATRILEDNEAVVDGGIGEVNATTDMYGTCLGNFKITYYCACEKCCNKADGITATGSRVAEGRTIAVDPSVIPYGTKVIIGGAVITQSYADEIGADGYSKDAADAVRLVQRLMELV